jgi:hypothetical protein
LAARTARARADGKARKPRKSKPDGDGDGKPTEAEAQLERFRAELQALLAAPDPSVHHDLEVARAQRRVWDQLALRCLERDDLNAAAKASRQAVAHGELVAKLERARLADRVAVLERELGRDGTAGRRIRDAARRRRKGK